MMVLPRRESPDALLCQRTIKALEQENVLLKERLAHSLTTPAHQLIRRLTSR